MAAFLKFLYSAEQILLPVVTCILFLQHKELFPYTSGEEGFLLGTFYLVALFIFFMQILLGPKLTDNSLQLSALILTPFLPILMEWYTSTLSISTLLYPGLVIFGSFMISFFLLVFIYPLFSLFHKSTTKNDVLNFAALAAAQCLFLIPGLGALWIIGWHVIQSGHTLTVISSLISLIIVLGINVRKIFPQILEESIFG